MTGSEKQIKWAQDIIDSRIGGCDRMIANWAEMVAKYPNGSLAIDTECLKIIKAAYEKIFADARFQTASAVIDAQNKIPTPNDMLTKCDELASKQGITKIEACKIICAI
jgi:hypothetical protein